MPAAAVLNLEHLLAPIDVSSFFRDHWQVRPFVVERREPSPYEGLLSLADVERIIAFTKPKFVDGGAFSGEPPRAATFVQGWLADRPLAGATAFPGIAELARVYGQGKTVVLMTVQQRWEPVAHVCRRLEAVFHCPVHANLYLTPEGAQGFDAHFDTHEVLVLQLEGSKTWRVYDSARTWPLVGERFTVPKDQLSPPREVRLEPGGLLYLPRGYVHEAFTSECASLHLTVGINIYRWADLLHEALAELTRRDARFRDALPPDLLSGGELPDEIPAHARELLQVLVREASVGDAVRSLGDQFFGELPVLPGRHFERLEEGAALDPDTLLERAPGMIGRVIQNGGWVELQYPSGRLGGPLKIAPASHFVARTERFHVRELPGNLGREGTLVLARRLVHEGIVTAADPG
jgi:ribosomal protein L16 Arg81 hydroxylase